MAIADFNSLLADLSAHRGVTALVMLVPLVAVVAYPLLARMLFSLRTLTDVERRQLMDALPQFDETMAHRIRVWNTGGRICNAAVVGCVPGFSFVLVSDALLTRLSVRSTAAILAHEMGHLRMWHVPMRLCIVFAGGIVGLALVHQAESLGSLQAAGQVAAMLTTAGYMGLMLHLVAPLLEFHADAFAIDALGQACGDRRKGVRTLVGALSRLTLFSGLLPNQRSWLYPSFEERRRAILFQQTSPRFRRWLHGILAVILLSQLTLIVVCLISLAN